MKSGKPPRTSQLAFPFALVSSLLVMAVASLILGVVAAVALLALDATGGQVTLVTLLRMLAAVLAGSSTAAVLWALAWLCRKHYHEDQTQRRMARALELLSARPEPPAEQTPPTAIELQAAPLPQPSGGPEWQTLMAEVRELNANMLLSEDQRRAKRQYLLDTQVSPLARQVSEAIAAGELSAAQAQLDRLVRMAPDLPEGEELTARLGLAAAAARSREAEQATRSAEEFMAAGQFTQAQAAAEELLARQPANQAAADLLARVRREAQAFTIEQRRRMYREVTTQAAARHWRDALAAAQRLLEAYPDSPEAEKVLARIDTVQENARIEEVRELRDRIRDLISRRRYQEALESARDLVDRFADTAGADELRGQLPRLEELARSGQDGRQ